jgi:hypothetical protein
MGRLSGTLPILRFDILDAKLLYYSSGLSSDVPAEGVDGSRVANKRKRLRALQE